MKYSRGTEIKLNNHNNYNISIGAIDKKTPKSLYIKLSGWGNPISENDENYTRIIRRMDKRIKSLIYNTINTSKFNQNKTMVDLDMRDSGIAYGKPSYMCCEITLFQHEEHLINSEFIITELNEICKNMISEVLNQNEYFKFHKKKTEAKKYLNKLNRKD
jgi:hypothetical protein